jgi:hypothetical protein
MMKKEAENLLELQVKFQISESRCMSNEDIDDCELEHLRGDFMSARSHYQLIHRGAYDDYSE